MSKLSAILQVCNDNLVCQMILWYFFWAYWDIPLMKVSVGQDSENSLKIIRVLPRIKWRPSGWAWFGRSLWPHQSFWFPHQRNRAMEGMGDRYAERAWGEHWSWLSRSNRDCWQLWWRSHFCCSFSYTVVILFLIMQSIYLFTMQVYEEEKSRSLLHELHKVALLFWLECTVHVI